MFRKSIFGRKLSLGCGTGVCYLYMHKSVFTFSQQPLSHSLSLSLSLSLITCLAKPAFDAPPPKKSIFQKSTFIKDRRSTYASLQTFFDKFASKRFATLLKCYYVGLKRYLSKIPAQVLSCEF